MTTSHPTLSSFLRSFRPADEIPVDGFTILGLRGGAPGKLEYAILAEALERGQVEVAEESEGGTVARCRVRWRGETPLFLLEGEELRGAKQNRVVNLSVLLERGSEKVVPVSCVEQSRWHYTSRSFSGGSRSPGSVLYSLMHSVTESRKAGAGYHSDQSRIWEETASCLTSSGTHSHTRALADAFETHQARLDEVVRQLGRLEGCSGYAVLRRGRLVRYEVFSRPETFARLRERILTGVAFDLLFPRESEEPGGPAPADSAEAELASWVERVERGDTRSYPGVGLGENLRVEAPGLAATALVVADEVAHFNLVTA